ncbi:hypothetical protein PQQ53_19960 [Paraburkholderia strydomiana]|uniref:hypothetical protein n=1 Tax=Paraburkholderia strydomiana TaxID=1245417 RepID=UPI0038B932BF
MSAFPYTMAREGKFGKIGSARNPLITMEDDLGQILCNVPPVLSKRGEWLATALRAVEREAGRVDMKNSGMAAVALLTIIVAGCSTEARIASHRDTEIALEKARDLAYVDCSARVDCGQLWKRTRLYVAQRSVTPIRHADDTTIETAEPHQFGAVYVWATRTSDASGMSTIRIKGICRGMYRTDGTPGWLYGTCAEQIRAVETDFRPFIGAPS